MQSHKNEYMSSNLYKTIIKKKCNIDPSSILILFFLTHYKKYWLTMLVLFFTSIKTKLCLFYIPIKYFFFVLFFFKELQCNTDNRTNKENPHINQEFSGWLLWASGSTAEIQRRQSVCIKQIQTPKGGQDKRKAFWKMH